MQCTSLISALIGLATACSIAFADSGGSVQNATGASKHASQAVTMGLAASGQATLGIAAVPLLSVGAVAGVAGARSTAAGKGSATATLGRPNREPLSITDETITVTSPAEALKR